MTTHTSIWEGTVPETDHYPCLEDDLTADVAIVGGGITGVTLAMLLSEAGKSVVLLEARRVGGGTTGNSTGNLYEVVSSGLQRLRSKWDRSVMRAVVQSRREAVNLIERTVDRLGIECDFHRCALHLYATTEQTRERVRREHEATVEAGVPARLEDGAPLGFPGGPTLVVENQAQFHPLAYVRGIAAHCASQGCRIHEQSSVTAIDGEARMVRTARGSVTARELVLATHTPKGFHMVQAEMLPHQEYGLGLRLASGSYPRGIFWGVGDGMHSLRSMQAGGEDFLVVVGDEYKTGQHDTTEPPAQLERFVCSHFDVACIDFQWCAQNFRPADLLPYIGRAGNGSGPFIATGFGTDGLTYGTLAATLIGHQILGHDNPWSRLYRAGRFAPVKAARGLVEENLGVAKALVTDYLSGPEGELVSIPPGAAAVVELRGEKVAAYRDAWGAYLAVSPVCTHMKCLVRWNDAEKSWDCPCHGSRFDVDGSVIEGPAIEPLARKSIE